MKNDFSIHNLFWKSQKEFEEFDPQLNKLKPLPEVYFSPLIKTIPVLTPGIYILTGGRQVGKSTVLKQIINYLLRQNKITASQIYFLPCDTITDFRQLLLEIEDFRRELDPDRPFVLLLDEITYVEEWERAIKSLADMNFFKKGSVLITGSDTILLKNAMMEFPGRRGEADQQDFHLYPLSFFEYVRFKKTDGLFLLDDLAQKIFTRQDVPLNTRQNRVLASLQQHFANYLLTGGYLLAINDYAMHQEISPATYKTYAQWVVGDIIKREKSEHSLREIINALYPRLSKQVTWHSFLQDLSIGHHQTVVDYINLLVRMDVLTILPALREDKLRPAQKKAKKVCFGDPFIFHSLREGAAQKEGFYRAALSILRSDGDLKNSLVEGTVASLFHRRRETYYIKAEGEVDLVLLNGKKLFPIEIKNSPTLRENDLKQILKYKQGLVGYAGNEIGWFKHLRVIPLSWLAYLADSTFWF